jgi:hypothetical protein
MGVVLSREIGNSGVPTPSLRRKATPIAPLARGAAGPARSETHCTCRTFLRENREIPRPPPEMVWWAASGKLN